MQDMTRRGFFGVAGVSLAGAVGLATTQTGTAAPLPGNTARRVDPTVWREYGEPLARATGFGVLAGKSVAVKDLYDIRGHRVGAGNEVWLSQSRPAQTTAPSVAALLAAGASLAGISRTDEFAYSLAGTNGHYGTPPNPRAPERIPGGSSSGSASAVALGQATIGLGTDTGWIHPNSVVLSRVVRNSYDTWRSLSRRPGPARPVVRHGGVDDPFAR